MNPSSLPALKLPGIRMDQEEEEEKVNILKRKIDDEEEDVQLKRGTTKLKRETPPTTQEFFPTNPENLQRHRAILDNEYEIQATTEQPRCLVSVVTHLHGNIPAVIDRTESIVNDANFIVKTVPNGNTLSTRLMAPAGKAHLEHNVGDDECPSYNSSLRFIYVSRMRLFLNLQCLPQVHFDETQPVKFLPRNYYNEDFSGYSEEGLASLIQFPDFQKHIDDPNYCQYFPEKREYAEKVFSSNPHVTAPNDEQLFGIYIDIAIISPKVDDETKSTVTVKTFILSNTSQEFVDESLRYIEELIGEGDETIKEELEEFIEIGKCKLSTIIEAISSYTQNKGVPDGNTKLFLTDLSCSVYKTFDDTPRKYKKIEPVPVSSSEQDEYNKEITRKLFEDYHIPENRAEDFIDEECTGYDAGCGLLTFKDIQGKTVSKSEIEKKEYDKIFTILKSKLSELRGKLALGGSLIFNKMRQRTRKGSKRRTNKRYTIKRPITKRRTNKRRTNKRHTIKRRIIKRQGKK
jgi:hypothetical protein